MEELLPAQWRARRAAHERRVDELVGAHLARRVRGEKHAVEDFLFTYYSLRPARLRRWHPGVGVVLVRDNGTRDHLDVAEFLARRGDAVRHVRDLVRATASRPAHLGCFGLHEWAMVYRHGADDERRHPAPLRLGAAGSDAVVEAHRIRCSHFDAFRFFTPEALGRNELQPTRASQVDLEQPGCLHATMDLYKWAYKLAPATPSELIADCFELARDARALDMQASPYDVRSLGYEPIPIETADGKAAYLARQRELIVRAEPLRAKLIEVCEALLTAETVTA
ncbi:MAG: 3-methyladenine DNA glycosylase [Kineosporiaceae bacterium]